MKKIILICLCSVFAFSCSKTDQKTTQSTTAETSVNEEKESVVNVYYFHGKKRCKTCIAVGDIAKQTIASDYSGNAKVKFTEIDTDDKKYKDLVEKYEVTWNALIIAKGDESKDITEDAFAVALENPDKLKKDIKSIVDSYLK